MKEGLECEYDAIDETKKELEEQQREIQEYWDLKKSISYLDQGTRASVQTKQTTD